MYSRTSREKTSSVNPSSTIFRIFKKNYPVGVMGRPMKIVQCRNNGCTPHHQLFYSLQQKNLIFNIKVRIRLIRQKKTGHRIPNLGRNSGRLDSLPLSAGNMEAKPQL